MFRTVLAASIPAAAGLCLVHLLVFGRRDVRVRDAGDEVHWWSPADRIVHACLALSFLALALSGYVLAFHGERTEEGFAGVFLRVHRSGGIFVLFALAALVKWFVRGLPKAYDVTWLALLGGYLGRGGGVPKAGRMNAGQKLWFWACCLLGPGACVLAGFARHAETGSPRYLLFSSLHAATAALLAAFLVVHLYFALLGYRGALRIVIDGRFSREAVRKYHSAAEGWKIIE